MNTIHRILVPVDFSEHSSFALQHAIALGRWYKAEIVGAHVADVPLPAPGPDAESRALAGLGPPLPPAPRQDLLTQVETFLEPARRVGLRAYGAVLEGHPARALA